MSKPNILLVGAGVMGSYHARVIAQSERANLSAIVDLRQEVGSTLAEKYGAQWLPELPNLDRYDAVIVAAPTEIHYDIAKIILAEKTPLLLEKPLTNNLKTTEELVALADDSDIPLMCGFLERYNPAVLTARQFVENPIHISTVRHSPYAPRIQTGVAWDLLVHDVDLISQLMGSMAVTKISGSTGVFHPNSLETAEDVAECVISFENSAIAHSSASRVGHRKVRSLVITEIDKLTEVDLLRRDVTVYRNVSDQLLDDSSRGYRQQTVIEIPEIITSQEPLAAQFDRYVDIIVGKVEASEERATLLPAHEIIDALTSKI